MTEYGLPFDGILVGDATKAPYSADEWARQWKLREGVGSAFPNYGVFAGSGDGTYRPLHVLATNPVSTNIQVQIGAALIDGRFYETTAAVTLPVGANASGSARVDTVVLRLDYVSQTIRLAVKQGTPAGSPVAPTMQQDSSFWEIPLADIAVANGFATLAQSTISQRQRAVQTSGFGWQPFAFPLAYQQGIDFDGANFYSLAANGASLAIPFLLSANMLVHNVALRSNSTNSTWGWSIYVQDTNDGLTAENTLRLVAESDGTSTINIATYTTVTLNAQNRGAYLPPGQYWLVIQNRHATNAFRVQFEFGHPDFYVNSIQRKTTTNPNGQTLDFATGWTKGVDNQYPAVIMQGRVFGQATAF